MRIGHRFYAGVISQDTSTRDNQDRAAHDVISKSNEYATSSMIEIWIDEAERRSWFLFEATR